MAKRLISHASPLKLSHQASPIFASNVPFHVFGRATQSVLWSWYPRKAFDGERRGPSLVQRFLACKEANMSFNLIVVVFVFSCGVSIVHARPFENRGHLLELPSGEPVRF